MEGGNKRRTRGKPQQNQEINTNVSGEGEGKDIANSRAKHEDMEAIQASIIAEIHAVRLDVKKEFVETIGQLKTELAEFRGEVCQKLKTIATDLKDITERVEETEQRISDMEELSVETKEMLSHTLELHEDIQAKLTDLEARSRRNNIRIHGIEEGTEGENIKDFIDHFIKAELQLPEAPLNIQRCHRSLGAKPPQGANPRSILVYFQEYKTKELVLNSAWKKREIMHDGKRVFFDQDFPTEIVMKRKAYAVVRKTLKEKALRFQTLYPAKLRVFYTAGPVIYNNATEATEDLIKRGLLQKTPGDDVPAKSVPAARPRQLSWETAGATSRRHRQARLQNIKDKLRGFRLDK